MQLVRRLQPEPARVVPARLPVPHKDFSDLYEGMNGKGESASEAHRARSFSCADAIDARRKLLSP